MLTYYFYFIFFKIVISGQDVTFTIPQAHPIFYIMQGYLIDLADMITEEIFKIALLELASRGIDKPLAFLSLITELCRMQGVEITSHPRKKLRLAINKAYILATYTNALDNMQGPTPKPQPKARAQH